MRIPTDLQEADQLLSRYGRWAMDRVRRQTCGSAEKHYRPSRDSESRREPSEVLIADFRAMDVQKALLGVPIQYRRILQAEYIPVRLPKEAQRRILRVTKTTWEGSHLAGLRMFWNRWHLHIHE